MTINLFLFLLFSFNCICKSNKLKKKITEFKEIFYAKISVIKDKTKNCIPIKSKTKLMI